MKSSLILVLFALSLPALSGDRPAERVPSGGAPQGAPAMAATSSEAVSSEVLHGPECLSVTRVDKTPAPGEYGDYTQIQARVANQCGQRVLAYGGRLELQSSKGPMSTTLGLWSSNANLAPANSAAGSWKFRVGVEAADIWLYAAPQQSLTWSWATSFVLLSDGTVYRSDVPMPEVPKD